MLSFMGYYLFKKMLDCCFLFVVFCGASVVRILSTNFLYVAGGEICQAGLSSINGTCGDGFYGDNCAKMCPEKTFGARCGGYCDCLPKDCDHKVGCLKQQGNSTQDEESMKCKENLKATTSTKRAVIITIGTIVCCILIFYISYEIRNCIIRNRWLHDGKFVQRI
ncbi:platelet endothelial aggregation receptor 1-like isoform X2 [Saccostrea cucullata]|uniref:platelet endothelial aggregation receptor 1-like isoform X2 n=1 Tax=Saccostrea cuccullata TaxID=36930 RepID=UPI002ED6095C